MRVLYYTRALPEAVTWGTGPALRTLQDPGRRPATVLTHITAPVKVGRGYCSVGMDQPWGWARIWAAVKRDRQTQRLRQGAWYPVMSTGATRIVLNLPGSDEPVTVPKDDFEIRGQEPERFTVVYGNHSQSHPARGTSADLGQTYAVCPKCANRVRLGTVPPAALNCKRCGHQGDVAWWETG